VTSRKAWMNADARAQNLERELTVHGWEGGALCVVLINATTNRSIEDSNAQTKQNSAAIRDQQATLFFCSKTDTPLLRGFGVLNCPLNACGRLVEALTPRVQPLSPRNVSRLEAFCSMWYSQF